MSAPAEDRTPSDVEELRQTIAQGLDSDPFAEKWEHEGAHAALRTLCDHVARLTAELADYALLKQAVNHSADCGPTCTPDGCAEDCPRLNTARWLTDQQREITRLTAALDRVRDDAERLDTEFLHRLVDVVWGEALDDASVPSTQWADRMIAAARAPQRSEGQ